MLAQSKSIRPFSRRLKGLPEAKRLAGGNFIKKAKIKFNL
jgi:hypothetical protein